jgi:hypothetical protein
MPNPKLTQEEIDEIYLKLHGAREALCLVQMKAPRDLARLLDVALQHIDRVGADVCPQWSIFDRSFEVENFVRFGNWRE